jgi:anhydro-N-acetylmuramic acid kinase
MTVTAIGLMSGTSMDGVDAALIETDGEAVLKPGPALTLPYPREFREALRRCLIVDEQQTLEGRAHIAAVEGRLTALHAEAVARLLAKAELGARDIDVIGFHGHTIRHAPEIGMTWQIGDGNLLAMATGIPVVNDFRTADVLAGGQGAPLVPLFHQALAEAREKPVVLVNIGGVANLTWCGAAGEIVAFDTGPGNALIDDWIFMHTGATYDPGGGLARGGRIDDSALGALLAHPFFRRAGPKSLDRNAFAITPVKGLALADGAATLTAFTVETILRGISLCPEMPREVFVCGGGRHNKVILENLQRGLNAPVEPIEAIGWDGDALEAHAFGFLAVRSLCNRPLTLPTTTGVAEPQSGGLFHPTAGR